jgi:hypothetical protein
MYAGSQVDDMLAAGATRTDYVCEEPAARLKRELAKRAGPRHIVVEKGDLKIEVSAMSGGAS